MKNELIDNLIINASLLLAGSLLLNMFLARIKSAKVLYKILLGVVIGMIAIFLISHAVPVSSGVVFDTRSILFSVVGLFIGYIPTIVAVIMASGFRIFLGGSGAVTGVLVIVLTASVGLIWNYLRLKKIIVKKRIWLEFYLFGLITHIIMLACMFTLPNDGVYLVLKEIGMPIIIIYPVVTLALCLSINQKFKNIQTNLDFEKSEAEYKDLYIEFQDKQLLLTSLLDAVPDLIFYKDSECKYTGCNQAFERFVGKKESDIIGHSDFDLFDQEMANLFRKMDLLMIQQKTQRKNDELVTYPDGNKVYLETLKTPYYDPAGKVIGLIGISRDISERKKREDEIQYLNFHDSLTGLYSRTFFNEAKRRLDTVDRLPLSIIIGDINGLKLINDAFGHMEGDKLLVAIAQILRSSCGAGDTIARTGGDEFCILLPNTDFNKAKRVYDQIKKACEEYTTQSDDEVYYTSISLGFATKTKANESLDKISKTAEENMYRRKLLENRSLHSSIISSIKTTLFEKSNETEEHAERMAHLSKKLGEAIDLEDEEMVSLELVSTLHDIGKISIDRNILTKTGKLNEEEWDEIKKHPSVGYRIAQTVPELRPIAEYILCHHERWDGNGYPQGLFGENIPLLSRILAIVDSFDAMTQDRSYRKAMSNDEAIAEIVKNSGTQFDPTLAQIFVDKVLQDDT